MKPNLVVWLMGGTGIVLLYSAVKNVNPGSLITSYFTGSEVSPLVDMDTGTKTKNGVVDPKSRGNAGPLLDPNNPNNLFPNGVNGRSETSAYVTSAGRVVSYPSGYVAPPTYQGA